MTDALEAEQCVCTRVILRHQAEFGAVSEPSFKPDMASSLGFGFIQDLLERLPDWARKARSPRLTRKPTSWRGLPRYREALDSLYGDGRSDMERHQYGKASTLYDGGDSIDFTYYADVAGFVPQRDGQSEKRKALHGGLEKPDVGNGDLSPEWGIDLRLNGGTITYGPWADRQRVDLQKAFFPAGYFDSEATSHLRAGDRRLHAALKIYIDFSRTTSLRVPTRESSKDWRYDGRATKRQDSLEEDQAWSLVNDGTRPYGWLDVQLGPNSSLSFVLPMLASETGWDAVLEVHMDALTVSSSVNYDPFVKARTARVSCLLPQPLKWDDPRTWVFKVSLHRPQLNTLRDHTFLLRDLAMDWTSGPVASMERFIPYCYKMSVTLHDYSLGLYLNERNIIDKSSIPEANTILEATGPRLHIELSIPADRYDAPYRTIPISMEGGRISLALNPPDWNTYAGFRTERIKHFGYVEKLNVGIEHTVFAHVSSDNVDSLVLDLKLDGVKFQVLGWVIKYLIEVKENYFGNFVNFVTPSEYRERHANGRQGDPVEQKYRPGQSNIFEVVLNLTASNSVALLSQEVYDCKSALALDLPDFGVHLRNHDYFMELAVNVAPANLVFLDDCDPILANIRLPALEPHRGWHLDGLTITSHRLFGPVRIVDMVKSLAERFSQQPRTSVYVANWEFSIGLLTMDILIPDFNALMRVGRAFALTYPDKENALPAEYGLPTDPDVTFLRVSMVGLDATVNSGEATAVHLALPEGCRIALDDIAADDWLQHIEIDVPDFQLAGLVLQDQESAIWSEAVSVDADLAIVLGKTAAEYESRRARQMAFLSKQDAATRRCEHLYSDASPIGSTRHSDSALFLPSLDLPLPRRSDQTQRKSVQSSQWAEKIRQYKLSSASAESKLSNVSHASTTYDPLLRKAYRYRGQRVAGAADGPTFVRLSVSD